MPVEFNNEVCVAIINAFQKEFPHGFINAGRGSLSTDTMFFSLGLIADKFNLPGNIRNNDPMHHLISVTQVDDDTFTAEFVTGGIMVNPLEPYLAMSTIRTRFRMATGDSKKIVQHMTKFFARLHEMVRVHAAEVYGRDRYDDKYFA